MTTKMNTISNFCWRALNEDWCEEFGDLVRIENRNYWDPIDLGVVWSCIGEVSPIEASEFAAKIQKAAMIAATSPVNGAKVIYSA